MTKRIDGFLVTLEKDLREDDAAAVVEAIKMIKGVVSVETHEVDMNTHFARNRIRHEMTMKLLKVFDQ